MTGQATFDVAIVGYGPAGVVAAALLGQAGHSVYVCDRLRGVYEIPRAISLDHEIMRVFQQLGVADDVARYCEPFTPSEYFGVDGQLIRRMTMVDPPYPQGYTPSLVFTQPAVERVLRERVAQLPNVTVVEGVECTKITQDSNVVTLRIRLSTLRWNTPTLNMPPPSRYFSNATSRPVASSGRNRGLPSRSGDSAVFG